MSGKNLINELRDIVGTDAVVADEQELLVYECDAYTLQKNLPTAVVLPTTTEEMGCCMGDSRRGRSGLRAVLDDGRVELLLRQT